MVATISAEIERSGMASNHVFCDLSSSLCRCNHCLEEVVLQGRDGEFRNELRLGSVLEEVWYVG